MRAIVPDPEASPAVSAHPESDGYSDEDEGSVAVTAVALEGVAFAYPDGRQALSGVDLGVDAGERLAVLGPNGSGKTTLALHLNGIHRPGRGTVRVCGMPVDKRHLSEVRRRVGLVFQDPDDQLFLPTVGEDVAFGPANLGVRGDDLDAQVADALGGVGLPGIQDRVPHHLSVGEKQRVALAGVLAMSPDVLVLDEPTAGLDPTSKRELAQLLAGLDVTLIVVTHDLAFALQTCPRAILLSGGVVVADGGTPALLADEELLHTHRLELPFGFDRSLLDEAG